MQEQREDAKYTARECRKQTEDAEYNARECREQTEDQTAARDSKHIQTNVL